MACGVTGFGDWICEMESGRPLGISTERLRLSRRDSRREEDDELCLSRDEEWCLDLDEEELFLSDEEWCLDDDEEEPDLSFEDLWDEDEDEDEEDFLSKGTSRMFRTRPVVGSVVDDWPGSWETW